jgi:hypothetical protein
MSESLKTNGQVNRDAASVVPTPTTEDGGSGSTHGSFSSRPQTPKGGGKLVLRMLNRLEEIYPDKAEQLRFRVGHDDWPDIRILFEASMFLIRSASY